MRVAVLGGGLAGVCTALELAECGCSVDIYEQDNKLVARASYWNEGKIHLGFVYAKDQSQKTASTMIEGALQFRPLLQRWIGQKVFADAASGPFIYAVHRKSIVSPESIESHFNNVAKLYDHFRRQPGCEYIGPTDPGIWRRRGKRETEALFSDEDICGSYETAERSLDTTAIAEQLRVAVAEMPNINALVGVTVRSVRAEPRSRYIVESENRGNPYTETYDAVINALWQNRLVVDETMGIVDARPVVHRFKIGFFADQAIIAPDLPSVTFVHGPFGDTVNYGSRMYISWYPAGLISTSMTRAPASHGAEKWRADVDRIEAETLAELGKLLPPYQSALRRSSGRWQAGGGYITAWGNTGIEDPSSQLHERFEVGVHSKGNYHSIDTGKYTLAPYLAHQACQRVVASMKSLRDVDWTKTVVRLPGQ